MHLHGCTIYTWVRLAGTKPGAYRPPHAGQSAATKAMVKIVSGGCNWQSVEWKMNSDLGPVIQLLYRKW
jgi:hypothetical protein